MVATKFLQDDGEEDGVINEEWATSAGITTSHLNQLERDFLDAIASIPFSMQRLHPHILLKIK